MHINLRRPARGLMTLVILGLMVPVLAACGQKESVSPVRESVNAEDIDSLRPAAPAPIDSDFRDDSAALVANTGRPQLLEFYAVW